MEEFRNLRIVFMGTPDFAVASLSALIEAECNVIAVITAPDKEAGRGMKLQESPVKKFALDKGLPIMQPEKLKNPDFLIELASLNADLQVVVAFRMLPEVVWSMPPMGTINVHGSLLPHYRGAAPINWAIINGEKETGVTTFKLKQEIDTGNILLQQKISINDSETAGELHDKMKMVGAEALVNTIRLLAHKTVQEQEQKIPGTEEIKHAPKIFTETCRIDWTKSVDDIYNLIRGLSPYPAAFTQLHNKTIKIYVSEKEKTEHSFAIGEPFSDGKTYLKYSCSDGFVHVKELQLEGKKRMLAEDFLRGYKWPAGEQLI